jgi:hypothetical protein
MNAVEAIAKRNQFAYLAGLKVKYTHTKKPMKVDYVLIQPKSSEPKAPDLNYEKSVTDENGKLADLDYEVVLVHGFNSATPTLTPISEFQKLVDYVE